ncbi:hypothetical protein Y032_0010g1195 [Ancylostoma ceylanicum]|uniref:C-type lectin domain-containing protein n=1 Tax=Ancylostoma ceylanicum TaxID=53326 RepID=A0A016VID0_9BILA|nr:hypothetical protein Y032_0010g1195 [Ancylostoma ceylanicum]
MKWKINSCTKNFQTGYWHWTDGSNVDYINWSPTQPSNPETEGCGQLMQDPWQGVIEYQLEKMKWNDISCDTPMEYFVCKRRGCI